MTHYSKIKFVCFNCMFQQKTAISLQTILVINNVMVVETRRHCA